MVAIIGYPGESKHTWQRFNNKKEALAWLNKTGDQMIRAMPSYVDAIASQRILSERAAAKCRYQDGTKCYPR